MTEKQRFWLLLALLLLSITLAIYINSSYSSSLGV
jgi:hypothetical protein